LAVFDIPIKGVSNWKFQTFGGGSIGAAIMVSGGQIILASPSGAPTTFTYGGIGGGWSAGLKIPVKLPRLGKVTLKAPKTTGAGAPFSFPSTGNVLMTTNCPGAELTASDFKGVCFFAELGGGLIVGGSGVVMLAGCQGGLNWWQSSLASLTGPAGATIQMIAMLASARAVIPMAGINAGIQAGGGVAGYVGAMF
jgi:hypothetical protein